MSVNEERLTAAGEVISPAESAPASGTAAAARCSTVTQYVAEHACLSSGYGRPHFDPRDSEGLKVRVEPIPAHDVHQERARPIRQAFDHPARPVSSADLMATGFELKLDTHDYM